MFYKNISNATKTFYGITFKPGDIKEVPGYINTGDFIAVAPPEKPSPVVAKAAPEPKNEPEVKKEPAKATTKSKNETKEENVDGTDNNQ